jgi:hypothetical protein
MEDHMLINHKLYCVLYNELLYLLQIKPVLCCAVLLGRDMFEFPLARMRFLAPGSAQARPSAQPPINTWGNFHCKCLKEGDQFLCHFRRFSLFLKNPKKSKFQNPTITPSGRKVTTSEREKKTPLIVDTQFCDSARKPLGPKFFRHNILEAV